MGQPHTTPGIDGRMPTDRPAMTGRIRFRMAEVARKRGITLKNGPHKGKVNMSELVRGTGAAQTTLFTVLRHPEQMKGVSFDLLARICEHLNCQPGDLMEYIPDERAVKYTLPERQVRPDWADEAIEGV